MAGPVGRMCGVIVADCHVTVHGALFDAEPDAAIGIGARERVGLVSHLRAQAEGGAFTLAPLRRLEFHGLIGNIQVDTHESVRLRVQAPTATDDNAVGGGVVTYDRITSVLPALAAKGNGKSLPV